MDLIKGYKIRNKETGEFSKGGSSGCSIWNKNGKTWTNIGHLKNHINQFIYSNGELHKDYPYHNAEIVEVLVKYEDCFTYNINILINDMQDKKEEKSRKTEELHRKWIEKREKKQLEELKKKYPNV